VSIRKGYTGACLFGLDQARHVERVLSWLVDYLNRAPGRVIVIDFTFLEPDGTLGAKIGRIHNRESRPPSSSRIHEAGAMLLFIRKKLSGS
jgi:hypothetical protein